MGVWRGMSGAVLVLVLAGCGDHAAVAPVTVTASRTVSVPARAPAATATVVPTGNADGSLHRFGELVSIGGMDIRVMAPARVRLARSATCSGDGMKVVVTIRNTGASAWPPYMDPEFTGMGDGVRACDASDIASDLLDRIPPGRTRTVTKLYALPLTSTPPASAPFTIEADVNTHDLYWTTDAAALVAVGR